MTTADLDILYLDMTVEEHIETALLFLDQSQQESLLATSFRAQKNFGERWLTLRWPMLREKGGPSGTIARSNRHRDD